MEDVNKFILEAAAASGMTRIVAELLWSAVKYGGADRVK